MFNLKKTFKKYLPDSFISTVRKVVFRGPNFRKEGNLFKIYDSTGEIYVPFIHRYPMYMPSVQSRIDYMLERYRVNEYTRDALIFDIGAHVGEFAIAAAATAKKIICFEPDPIARSALLKNTKRFENILVVPEALSNKDSIQSFYVATKKADSSLFQPEEFDEKIEVKAKRLDSYDFSTSEYSNIILKMDAEGFEPEVLQGAISWLKRIDLVSIDVAPERGDADTYKDVKDILDSLGFEKKLLTDDEVLVAENLKKKARE